MYWRPFGLLTPCGPPLYTYLSEPSGRTPNTKKGSLPFLLHELIQSKYHKYYKDTANTFSFLALLKNTKALVRAFIYLKKASAHQKTKRILNSVSRAIFGLLSTYLEYVSPQETYSISAHTNKKEVPVFNRNFFYFQGIQRVTEPRLR